MKQTAIEWLESQLFELRNPTLTQIEIIEEAKEKEKEKIIDAYQKGYRNGGDNFGYGNKTTPIEYYNETFKNK